MPLLRQALPSLYGGVSQQSAVIRSSNQVESAVNCSFSVAWGCSKRPPLEVLSQLSSSLDTDNTFFHWVPHPSGNRYLMAIPGDGSFAVFDLSNGLKISATDDSGVDYLMSSNARKLLRAVTLGDVTYIANTETTVLALTDTTAGSIAGVAQTLQDDALNSAAEGAIYKIVGDAANAFDTYYAKKVGGRFFEWVEPGITFKLDPATLPVTVHIDAVSTVAAYAPMEPAERTVGDLKSNADPSFVGRTVTGLVYAHDRLGLMSGNAIVFSEIGKYQNWYRTTVTDVIDTDRIDVKVSSDDIATLYWAKPIGKSIMLFAPARQFTMDGQQVFSPRTISVNQTMAYPSSEYCEPVSAGPNVYFPVDAGSFSNIREAFIQDQTFNTDAANVTAHVPEYLPDNVSRLVASNNFDVVFALSDNTPNRLWTYQYMWQGDQKIQSAWNYWLFDPLIKILDMCSQDHWLYVVYRFTGSTAGTYFGRINLKLNDPGAGTEFKHPVHYDQLTRLTGAYNAVENRTYFVSPFPIYDTALRSSVRVVRGVGFANKGTVITPSGSITFHAGPSNNQFYFAGDHSGGVVYVGFEYDQRLTFSEQYASQGDRSTLNARLQIRDMSVSYLNSAYFKTEVKVRGIDPSINQVIPGLTSTYTARTIGDEYFTLNSPQLATGVFRFPVLGKSSDVTITLSNSSYLPCNWQTAEWEGLVTSRTRR